MQADYAWCSVPRYSENYKSSTGELTFAFLGMGFNVRARSERAINYYGVASIGIAFDDLLDDYSRYRADSMFAYKFGGGIDIPLEEFLCFTVEGGVIGVEAVKPTPYTKIGVAFTLPNLVF